MSRDQRIDQSATSYCICKFKTTVRGATYFMTSHVSSALWTLHYQCHCQPHVYQLARGPSFITLLVEQLFIFFGHQLRVISNVSRILLSNQMRQLIASLFTHFVHGFVAETKFNTKSKNQSSHFCLIDENSVK